MTDMNFFAPDISQFIDTSDVIRWSPTFSATGLTFTGSNDTYPTFYSYYIKLGRFCSFYIACDLSTVTNFGTGQYKFELPFLPLYNSYNHFQGWLWKNSAVAPDDSNHIYIIGDHLQNTKTLDLHFMVEAPSNPKPVFEKQLTQSNLTTEYQLTTASKIFLNGSYITQE